MNHLLVSVSPLVIMMFVSSITPGPNNLLLMLAGTRYGFLRTLPHLSGITAGSMLVICLVYAGLGSLMLGHPRVTDAMTIACGAYLLWLAGRVLRSAAPAGTPSADRVRARPMRFAEAVAFQFVNPKVWMMAVAATGIAGRFPFSPGVSLAVIAATTVLVNSPCIALWAAFGRVLRHRLEDPGVRRVFDSAMALLIVATAVWIVWPLVARVSA